MNENQMKEQEIVNQHQERERLLEAIRLGNREDLEIFEKKLLEMVQQDKLQIFKRIPDNKLRSYKNFLLSHNTLYSYSAEKGGLHPALSHYLSEKYAIMIEHTHQMDKLDEIHVAMIEQYGDLSLRYHKKTHPSLVNRIEEYIDIHFSEDSTIAGIAKKLHAHPSHLMRTFKKEKNMTISQFRNERRLKEAKELIMHSHLTITEIALMVGFSNVQYFTKLFKEKEGKTPKSFR
ncbi:helix-turn-helix domain-containing protein [Gracilibacillus massiliensis]|uniref:helix-turn-helix domain-containing protein n=1 Tax=Gracilibacillus massiliensis TaxID=1564956 RepID=UPI00071DCD1F|nr:helix-turn-helix domain-containing protein [Gracilibacillus massiliensis]